MMIRNNSDERLVMERTTRAMASYQRSNAFNNLRFEDMTSSLSSLRVPPVSEIKIDEKNNHGADDDHHGTTSTAEDKKKVNMKLTRQACFLMEHCILKNKICSDRSIIDEIIRTFCQQENQKKEDHAAAAEFVVAPAAGDDEENHHRHQENAAQELLFQV